MLDFQQSSLGGTKISAQGGLGDLSVSSILPTESQIQGNRNILLGEDSMNKTLGLFAELSHQPQLTTAMMLQSMESKFMGFQNKFEELAQQNSKAQTEFKQEIGTLRETVSNLTEKIAEKNNQIQKLSDTVEELNSRLLSKEEKIQTLTQVVQERDKRIACLEERMSRSRSNNTRCSSRYGSTTNSVSPSDGKVCGSQQSGYASSLVESRHGSTVWQKSEVSQILARNNVDEEERKSTLKLNTSTIEETTESRESSRFKITGSPSNSLPKSEVSILPKSQKRQEPNPETQQKVKGKRKLQDIHEVTKSQENSPYPSIYLKKSDGRGTYPRECSFREDIQEETKAEEDSFIPSRNPRNTTNAKKVRTRNSSCFLFCCSQGPSSQESYAKKPHRATRQYDDSVFVPKRERPLM